MATDKAWSLIALLLTFAVIALVGTMDAKDADISNEFYCAMVAQWDKDAELGVAPEQRSGWPPYDGRKQCNKEH